MNFTKFESFLKIDRGLSPLTIETYVIELKQMHVWFTEKYHCLLHETCVSQIEEYFLSLKESGLNTKSVSKKLSALKSYLDFAITENWITSNPTASLKIDSGTRSLPSVLSLEEIERLLHSPLEGVAPSPQARSDFVLLRFFYASGARVSEVVNLERSWIDFEAGKIRVLGKGSKTRMIPLDQETNKLLLDYDKNLRPHFAKGGAQPSFFLSRIGKPYTRQGLWKIIKKYALKAGLEKKVSPHALRHAFATHLTERGMNLRSVQKLLGHEDISTTQVYSHISQGHLTETLERFHPKSKKS